MDKDQELDQQGQSLVPKRSQWEAKYLPEDSRALDWEVLRPLVLDSEPVLRLLAQAFQAGIERQRQVLERAEDWEKTLKVRGGLLATREWYRALLELMQEASGFNPGAKEGGNIDA